MWPWPVGARSARECAIIPAIDLTAPLARESKPTAKDTILFDKALPGFGLPSACDPDAFVFERYAEGRGVYSLSTCWRAVCADAKLGGLRLHDLRHTAASQAVMAGKNLPLVGKLLGHRRHRTTAGYAHLADAHLVEVAERVGAFINEAMNS